MKLEEINIQDVINRLGLAYTSCGNGEFKIKGTDGWSFNIHKNMIKDFSKDRGEGNPFTFIQEYLRLDKQQTIDWFKDNFNLEGKKEIKKEVKKEKLSKEKREELKTIWNSLPLLNEKEINYLENRGIDYILVKDFVKSNNGITCLLYDENGPIGARTRLIEGEQRFGSIKGFQGDGVYLYKIDTNKDYVIVVEGMFDFLTLRQFDSNVVGLGSAEQGIEVIKQIAKKYKIIFIPDNDEAGKNTTEKLKQHINFELIDWSDIMTEKDTNELYLSLNKPNDFMDLIYKGTFNQKISKIDIYDDNKTIAFDHITKNPYTWGLEKIDKSFGKPEFKELAILVGYPSCGKTEYTFYMTRENLKRGVKVLYLSLELPKDSLFKRVARKRAGVSKYQYQIKEYSIEQQAIMDTELDKLQKIEGLKVLSPEDKTLDNLEKIIRYYKDDGYGMIFIDNLGKIDRQGEEEITAFDSITSRLQDLKNELSIPIVLLHHLKKANNNGYGTGGGNAFRGNQKIKDNCSIMIELWRDLDPESGNKNEVKLCLYKDTEDGITGEEIIYFNKGDYYEENNF